MTQAITFSQFQLPSHAPSSAQWTLKLLTKLKKGRLEIVTPEVFTCFLVEKETSQARKSN